MFKEQLTTTINYHKIKSKLGVVMVFKISTIISLLTLLTLTITISILSANSINHFFNITTTGWQFYSIKIYLILIFCLLLISSILLCIISWTVKTDDIDKNIIIISILAIFSINPVALIFNLVKHYQWQKAETFAILKARWWTNFKLAFGIRRWLIIDYTIIGLFTALTIVCVFIEQILPKMPYGGGVAIKYLPLMVVSYILGFAGGWLTGMISALMSLLFISSGYIISAWSFLLDYFLPMTTPAIVALLRFNLRGDKSIFTYINYFLHCFLVCLIIYVWQTIVGYFVWAQITNANGSKNIWPGFTPLFYALVYNFIHIFLFTYPIMQLTIPFIYRGVVSHYLERYH
ncbi:energy-coupled thiamine transporter ThiT [Spiroplasma endosymbiont of Polydrusus pterygomalis]|uniref:energy-coupled thiamine transporter ThiT n=1 Tax=Spiroplasma endosymbiont of Polydrusus pterygomalis TaxID=3139327 RepID=UPI003CCB229F